MLYRTKRGEPKLWLEELVANPPDTNDCIEWPFACVRGYPIININGKNHYVARLVLIAFKGFPPNSNCDAAHLPKECHNRKCLNPKHLRWATHKDNSADRTLDDTENIGERNGRAILTKEQVLDIYSDPNVNLIIALKHRVSESAIKKIKSGQTWAHVTGHKK